ncbi:MAG: ISAzo13-like element transposase-related protein [Planctomycetales bacterium]
MRLLPFFRHLSGRVKSYRHDRHTAISVDTRKNEVPGGKANVGRECRAKVQRRKVDTHDFPDTTLGRPMPYGVRDVAENEAMVSAGVNGDAADFAVKPIRC